MSSVRVYLNTSVTSKEGTYPLVIQLIHQRNKKMVRTSYNLNFQDYDAQKMKAVFVTSHKYPYTEQEVNQGVAKRVELMHDILTYLNDYVRTYDVDDVMKLYKIGVSQNLLCVFAAKTIRELCRMKQYCTSNSYQSALNKLLIYVGSHDLTFEEVDKEWVDQYKSFLEKEKLQVNSIYFYLRMLRAIYNRGQKEGLVQCSVMPFSHLNLSASSAKEVDIEDDELNRIITAEVSHDKSFVRARDLFLFCYYSCGMSFMDMGHLKKTDVKEDMLTYYCNRTKKVTNVNISPQLKVLIDKYIKSKGIYLLPIFDSEENNSFVDYRKKQRIHNNQLKRLASFLEIDCNLNCHVAQTANKSRNTINELSVSFINAKGKKETIKILYTSIEEAKAFLIKAIDDLKKRV